MTHTIQPAGIPRIHPDVAWTIIALAALACILGSLATPSLLGAEIPYTTGAAVVVGLGAVACSRLASRTVRIIAACVVLGLVLIRAASTALPATFVQPHSAPSLPDSIGLTIMLSAAIATLIVAALRR